MYSRLSSIGVKGLDPRRGPLRCSSTKKHHPAVVRASLIINHVSCSCRYSHCISTPPAGIRKDRNEGCSPRPVQFSPSVLRVCACCHQRGTPKVPPPRERGAGDMAGVMFFSPERTKDEQIPSWQKNGDDGPHPWRKRPVVDMQNRTNGADGPAKGLAEWRPARESDRHAHKAKDTPDTCVFSPSEDANHHDSVEVARDALIGSPAHGQSRRQIQAGRISSFGAPKAPVILPSGRDSSVPLVLGSAASCSSVSADHDQPGLCLAQISQYQSAISYQRRRPVVEGRSL